MASHERTLKPGDAQLRRAAFCWRMFYFTFGATFLAVIFGIPFPGTWERFGMIVFPSAMALELLFLFIFLLRAGWLKFKAAHYRAIDQLRRDEERKRMPLF
jgi:hypothetical protein